MPTEQTTQNTTTTPTTTRPVELDGWYEHTDGTYGFYTGAARAGGPRMSQGPCLAHECVHRDKYGAIYAVGWPAKTARVPAPRFLRVDGSDRDALALVRLTSGHLAGTDFPCQDLDGRDYPYLVQVTSGPDSVFRGLFDLDGDPVDVGNAEWEIVTEAPAEVIAQIETSWESGTSVVTRLS